MNLEVSSTAGASMLLIEILSRRNRGVSKGILHASVVCFTVTTNMNTTTTLEVTGSTSNDNVTSVTSVTSTQLSNTASTILKTSMTTDVTTGKDTHESGGRNLGRTDPTQHFLSADHSKSTSFTRVGWGKRHVGHNTLSTI